MQMVGFDAGLPAPEVVWCHARTYGQAYTNGPLPGHPFRLWWLLAGCIDVDLGTRVVRYEGPGSWFVAPPAFVQQTLAAGTEMRSIGLQWRLDDGSEPLKDLPVGRLVAPARCLDRLGRRLKEQIRLRRTDFRAGEPAVRASGLTVETALQVATWRLVQELLPWRVEPPAGPLRDPRVLQAMHELRRCCRGPFPGGDGLESLTGVGLRRLEQLFKDAMGSTPRACHELLRQEEARRLLVQGQRQIKAVARLMGFASLSAFTQWFTRTQGMSPSRYRQRIRT